VNEEEGKPETGTTSAQDRSSAKILIVDDRPENLLALEAILEPLGHPVVRAESGRQALRELLAGDFAVILLDVHMPELDGYETAGLIKQRDRTRRIPIIFLTAMSQDVQLVVRGYAQGAVDYMSKPFDPRVLRAKVSVFLDLHLKTEQIKQQAARLKEQEREALLSRSEARFRNLINLMPIAAWAARPDGTVYFANEAARSLSGNGEGDGTGALHLTALGDIHEEDRERVAETWRRALERHERSEIELRIYKHPVGYKWHLGRGVPELEDGVLTGWIATATDIDDQKRAEETQREVLRRTQEAHAQAEAANRMKDEFLATVSHELRTPLTALLGWSTLLRRRIKDADPELLRAMEALERNARVQSQLVEDLLDVSRIIAGKLRLEIKRAGLREIVQAAAEAVAPAAAAKGVTVDVVTDPALAEIQVDPDRLQQVIWNLLSNAIKFTPSGGRVRIESTQTPDGYEIGVTDTGVGIAPEFLPFVFERFRQADSSTTRAAGGLGLGLAIVRHLVELHGGTVEAESDGDGRGARFVVKLPHGGGRAQAPSVAEAGRAEVVKVPAAALPPAASPVAPPDLQGLRVLIVDDSQDNRELLAEVLALQGAVVDVASNVPDALKLIDGTAYDVLISDLGMPGEDGYSLVQKVRELERGGDGHLPAIALTGFARAEDKARVEAAGFDAHMTKPVEPDLLIATVAKHGRCARKGDGHASKGEAVALAEGTLPA
jgi:PAS domain S-box-containing protein